MGKPTGLNEYLHLYCLDNLSIVFLNSCRWGVVEGRKLDAHKNDKLKISGVLTLRLIGQQIRARDFALSLQFRA